MHYRTQAIAGVVAIAIALAWGMTRTSYGNPARDIELSSTRMESCQMCHTMDPVRSHPINVVPWMAVPTGLPLVEGKVSCTTCHLDDQEAHIAARVDHKGMLRLEMSTANACATCHDARSGTRATLHALAVGRAHLRSRNTSQTAASIDTQSQSCVACHDGLVSSDVEFTTSPGSPMTMGLGSHPIGVALVAGMMPDPRLQLVDGRVACATCHSPYSSEKKLLIMSNTGSKLCLTCHSRI